jgi:hypothetical protein
MVRAELLFDGIDGLAHLRPGLLDVRSGCCDLLIVVQRGLCSALRAVVIGGSLVLPRDVT